MDPNLAALQVAIEAASPGTPSLTCLRIADAVAVVLREAKAEAWDEGYEKAHDTCPYAAPHVDPAGLNPYRD